MPYRDKLPVANEKVLCYIELQFMKTLRQLRLLGATGQIRTGTYQDREHLVIPVVALVEGVIWASNSKAPELCLASEFQMAPKGWNGRPIVVDHPEIMGNKVSANERVVLEAEEFGRVFNAEAPHDRLLLEAWLDKERAQKVGDKAVQIINRAQSGEGIEVSTGLFMNLEEKEGQWNGIDYSGIWRSIVPDHLAMLPDGMKGACSIEMGCGAPRASSRYFVLGSGLRAAKENDMSVPATSTPPVATEPTPQRSLKERFFDLVFSRIRDARSREELTDREVRNTLERALRAEEPGFLGVDFVFPFDNKVVYAVMPGDKFQTFQRTYKISTKGEVSLGDDRDEVEPVTRFEPVTASSQSQPCGCQKPQEGAGEMDKAARINALIASKKYQESDRAWLEAVPEQHLATLEGKPETPASSAPPSTPPPAETPASTPAPTQVPSGPAPTGNTAGATPQTAEQFIALAPKELQESLREGYRASQQKREGLVQALKATNRCSITDEKLRAMSINELEQLAQLASVPTPEVTFIGAPVVRENKGNDGFASAPRDMVAEYRASAKK